MILFGDYAPETYAVDLGEFSTENIMANLEGSIIPAGHAFAPSQKAGPSLCHRTLPSRTGLAPGRIIYSLANNHSMDYGWAGVQSTVSAIESAGDLWLGAGANQAAARKPLLVQEHGKKIAIVACCERQFGIAEYGNPGCAAIGEWLYDAILQLKREVDYVLVSCHAGVEDSPWPSPFLQSFYRSLINCGADVIHGHHAHTPQPVERYGNGIIAYGLGNWVVPCSKWQKYPNGLWSLAVRLNFSEEKVTHDVLYIESPCSVDKILVQLAKNRTEKKYYQYLETIRKSLCDERFFLSIWQEISLRCFNAYAFKYLFQDEENCNNIKSKLSMLLKNTNTERNLLLSYVMITCQSHRDIIETALGILSGAIPDRRTEYSKSIVEEYMDHI